MQGIYSKWSHLKHQVKEDVGGGAKPLIELNWFERPDTALCVFNYEA